jgi:hypothetical protein|tara:strand:+ start:1447 stop:1647 length:201 start_codon:yes stop_codon:yes gene_type:complete
LLLALATCFTEIFIGIKMNSNNSNHTDGSFHIYLDELPRDKNGKLIVEKKTEEKKEVKKDDKKDRK